MTKKKLVISLFALATLLPLAGCYSPYYDRYGYDRYGYDQRYAPYGDGYNRNDGYGYSRDYRDDRGYHGDRDTGNAEGSRPGNPYYDNYTPR